MSLAPPRVNLTPCLRPSPSSCGKGGNCFSPEGGLKDRQRVQALFKKLSYFFNRTLLKKDLRLIFKRPEKQHPKSFPVLSPFIIVLSKDKVKLFCLRLVRLSRNSSLLLKKIHLSPLPDKQRKASCEQSNDIVNYSNL